MFVEWDGDEEGVFSGIKAGGDLSRCSKGGSGVDAAVSALCACLLGGVGFEVPESPGMQEERERQRQTGRARERRPIARDNESERETEREAEKERGSERERRCGVDIYRESE